MSDDKFKVFVHYVAAGQPFEDEDADRSETLGHLKARVLTAFGLTEGSTPEGNTTVYTLHHGAQALEDPSVTLGAIAGDKKVLQLNLVQQIVQG